MDAASQLGSERRSTFQFGSASFTAFQLGSASFAGFQLGSDKSGCDERVSGDDDGSPSSGGTRKNNCIQARDFGHGPFRQLRAGNLQRGGTRDARE